MPTGGQAKAHWMVNPVGMESGALIDLVYTAANAGKASMGVQSPIDLGPHWCAA